MARKKDKPTAIGDHVQGIDGPGAAVESIEEGGRILVVTRIVGTTVERRRLVRVT